MYFTYFYELKIIIKTCLRWHVYLHLLHFIIHLFYKIIYHLYMLLLVKKNDEGHIDSCPTYFGYVHLYFHCLQHSLFEHLFNLYKHNQ